MTSGSPLWQVGLLFFAVVFLAFEAWRGWRCGLVRSIVNLAALVLSGVFGLLAGQAAGALVGGADKPTGFLVGVLVGGGIALAMFFGIWVAGAVLLKRTAHHSGLFRWAWGLGGALVGSVTGLLILWGAISIIRALGALGEGTAQTAASQDIQPPAAASGLVVLKESLEMGPPGQWVQSLDPVPNELYEILSRVARLTSDPQAMRRFLEYPQIQKVLENPRLVALLSDPEVVRAAERGNYLALMGNKALHDALDDPQLAAQIRQIDLRAALDHALAAPPGPAP